MEAILEKLFEKKDMGVRVHVKLPAWLKADVWGGLTSRHLLICSVWEQTIVSFTHLTQEHAAHSKMRAVDNALLP